MPDNMTPNARRARFFDQLCEADFHESYRDYLLDLYDQDLQAARDEAHQVVIPLDTPVNMDEPVTLHELQWLEYHEQLVLKDEPERIASAVTLKIITKLKEIIHE